MFYITVNDNGKITKASTEMFDGAIEVNVPVRFSDYFIANLNDFMMISGSPNNVAIPKDNFDFTQKINDQNNKAAIGFSAQQIADLMNDNKELKSQVAFLATQIKGDK